MSDGRESTAHNSTTDQDGSPPDNQRIGTGGDFPSVRESSTGPIESTRRFLLRVVAGIAGFGGGIIAGASTEAEADSNGTDGSTSSSGREGVRREGSTIMAEAFSEGVVDVMTSNPFGNTVVDARFEGVAEQVTTFGQEMQGFPTAGDEYVFLSSGDATEAAGDPSTFLSTSWENGRSFDDYSPDGYDAFDVADLELDVTIPEDAEGIAFDYAFATEESPSYLNSAYQDFFEVILFTPEDFDNIALINGEPVTVDQADTVANTPGGTSLIPTPPFPDPADTAFNAVTSTQTVSHDVSALQGEEVTVLFRVADASDAVFDSGVILDNLRFTNDVDTDVAPVKKALQEYESAFKELQKSRFTAQAHFTAIMYDELGDSFGDLVVDYWEYKAGNNSGGELDEETREMLDAILDTQASEGSEGTDAEFAEVLASFYAELFGAMSKSDSLETLKETARAYYMGSGEGQSVFLRFGNGETPDDVLNSAWGISENLFNRIQASYDPSAGEYQDVIEAISEVSSRLQRRRTETIATSEHRAQKIATNGDDRFELQVEKFEGQAPGEVESQIAAATVGLLLIAGSFVAGGAVAYTVTKCSGSYSASQLQGVKMSPVSISIPLASQITTIENMRTELASYANVADSDLQGESVIAGAMAKAGAVAGMKTAGADLAFELTSLSLEWSLAQSADAEIVELDLPAVTDEKELGLIGSFVDWIKQSFYAIWPYDSYSKSTIGEAEGTLTIRNPTTDVYFQPMVSTSYNLFDGSAMVPSPYKPRVEGDTSTMNPGEVRELDVTYQAPRDKEYILGSMRVDLGFSPSGEKLEMPTGWTDLIPVGLCELDYFALQADSQMSSFNISDAVSSETIADSMIQSGETITYEYTVATDAESTLIELTYADQAHYLDLHIYDGQGNHVGYNYDSNSVEEQIPGATYSGRDTGQTDREWISLEEDLENSYDVTVVAPEVGTVGQGVSSQALDVSYEVTSSKIPTLPPHLSATSSITVGDTQRGMSASFAVLIEETNGDNPLGDVSLSPNGLTQLGGDAVIEAGNVTFEQNVINVSAGESTLVEGEVEIPENIQKGTYSGEIEIATEQAGSAMTEITVQIPESSITVSGAGGNVDPGNSVGVSLTIENSRSSPVVGPVIRIDGIPSSWEVSNHSDDGGTFKSENQSWLWLSLPGGSDRSPSLTLEVPENADDGEYNFTVKAFIDGSVVTTGSLTVSVGEGPIPQQYDHAGDDDDEIDLAELQDALTDWSTDSGPDPSVSDIQTMIKLWKNGETLQ